MKTYTPPIPPHHYHRAPMHHPCNDSCSDPCTAQLDGQPNPESRCTQPVGIGTHETAAIFYNGAEGYKRAQNKKYDIFFIVFKYCLQDARSKRLNFPCFTTCSIQQLLQILMQFQKTRLFSKKNWLWLLFLLPTCPNQQNLPDDLNYYLPNLT